MEPDEPRRYNLGSSSPDAVTRRWPVPPLHATQRVEWSPILAAAPHVTRGGLRRDTRLLRHVSLGIAIVLLLLTALLRWTPPPMAAQNHAIGPQPIPAAPRGVSPTSLFIALPASPPTVTTAPVHSSPSVPSTFASSPVRGIVYVPPAAPLPPDPVTLALRP